MILADTSVWVAHLRSGLPELAALLNTGRVLTHSFVIGELACGHLRQRTFVMKMLHALPRSIPASNDEVLHMIEEKHLYGTGIGWVGCHLLASAMLTRSRLWATDQRLRQAAEHCKLDWR